MTIKLKAFSAALLLAGYSLGCAAQGPVTYAITTFDLNNGVGVSSSASYKLTAAVGDTFLGGAMSGGNYSLKSGMIAQMDIPVAKLDATSLSFASQGVNVTSSPMTVNLINYGVAPLNVSSVTPSGDFAVSSTNCSGSAIATNDSCSISVTFKPTATGSRTGTVIISANTSIPGITLSGTGTLNAQTISFGAAPNISVGSSGNITATASSGLTPITFTSSTPTCAVSGITVTGVNAGTCTINASQAGNGAYAATSNSLSFSIATASSGGEGTAADSDTPLPAWMLYMLGSGLLASALRRRRQA